MSYSRSEMQNTRQNDRTQESNNGQQTNNHVDIFGDYKANRDQGFSPLASGTGAVVGAATRGVTQIGAIKAVGATANLLSKGITTTGLGAAAGTNYIFSKIDHSGRVASQVTAQGVDALFSSTRSQPETKATKVIDEATADAMVQAAVDASKEKEQNELEKLRAQERSWLEAKYGPNYAVTLNQLAGATIPSQAAVSINKKEAKKTVKATASPLPLRETVNLTTQDEKTAEFLLRVGDASRASVVTIYQDSSAWEVAKQVHASYRELELKFERQQDHAGCTAFLNGIGNIFDTFSRQSNKELAHIGKEGAPIISKLVSMETNFGIFSGGAGLASASAFATPAMIVGFLDIGFYALSRIFAGDEEDQQNQLAETLNLILQRQAMFETRMHERFDRLEDAMTVLGKMMSSYCQQILRNQQVLFEQNRQHIEISLQGFRIVSSMLHDSRVENRYFHDRTYQQFLYLISLTEDAPLQRLKESIVNIVSHVERRNKMTIGYDKRAMLDNLINLENALKLCTSPAYNGMAEFDKLESSPLQALQFLVTRGKNHDYALGFLAKVMERATQKSLASAGIDIALLPVTAIWFKAVEDYTRLTKFPAFADVDTSEARNNIAERAENLRKFIQYIRVSGLVPILLTLHQHYLSEFQKMIFALFTKRREKESKEQKWSASKTNIATIGEYFKENMASLEGILYAIEYNYFLLKSFAYLGGLSPEAQAKIAQLDNRSTLLKQSFNFDESPGYVRAGALTDASMAITYQQDNSYTYRYPYQYEHLEMTGSNLYGAPGEEKIIFVTTRVYSEDWPAAANSCSLNISQYDVTSKKVLSECIVRPDTGPKPPFPLIQYKGNYNQSVNHAWGSSHIVSMHKNPQLVLFTGGSGHVRVFDITNQQWISNLDDGPGLVPPKFDVPLPSRGNPNMTCYTNVLLDRYLFVNQVIWPNGKPLYPQIHFYAFDTQNRWWLTSYELETLFTHQSEKDNFNTVPYANLYTTKAETVISPNQFFVNKLKLVGRSEAMVYGILQADEKLSAQFYYKQTDPDADYLNFLRGGVKSKAPESKHVSSITAKKIHQTKSEVLMVNGENTLVIAASITNKDGENSLVFLMADLAKNEYDEVECKLQVPLHRNSDWQAMRTAVATIAGKPQLIVTLLDSTFKMLIWCYDPSTKKLTPLPDGPQLKFIKFDENGLHITPVSCERDPYLFSARRTHPGYYPVRSIEIRTVQSKVKDVQCNDMTTLQITYPSIEGPGPLNYELRVMEIPLSPVLKIKPISNVSPLLTTQASSTALPRNHLEVGLRQTQLLLSEPRSLPDTPAKDEKNNEEVFKSAIRSCKNLQKLFSAVVTDIKLSDSIQALVTDEIKTMNEAVSKLSELDASTSEGMQKVIFQIQEVYKLFNTIDGYFKLDKNYISGIGVNINRQIKQLKAEIANVKKLAHPHHQTSSAHRAKSIFSDGAKTLEQRKKREELLKAKMASWEASFKSAPSSQAEALGNEAKKWSVTCKDMKHDGNCLYHAIEDQLKLRSNMKTITWQNLKEKAMNHFLTNLDNYKDFVEGDLNSFISKHLQAGTWADEIFIRALARELNVTIVNLRSDQAEPNIIKPPKSTAILYLGYEVDHHFQSVQGQPSADLQARVELAEVDNFVVQMNLTNSAMHNTR